LCSQGGASSRNNSFLAYNDDYTKPAKALLAIIASPAEAFFKSVLRASHTTTESRCNRTAPCAAFTVATAIDPIRCRSTNGMCLRLKY
jgi:hypothetical protein